MNEALIRLAEESENPVEFFLSAFMLCLVHMVFRLVEVVIYFAEV